MSKKNGTKAERMEAARDEFARIDEYARGPAIATLASRHDISYGEAATIVDEPAHMIAEMRRAADKASVQGEGCHYCGLPAVKTNFFGAPICRTC